MAMNLSNIATAKPGKKTFDIVSSEKALLQKQSGELRALQLSEKLFRTLDVKNLIDLFFEEIQSDIPHDSIGYTNKTLGIALSLGKMSRHRMEYNIVLAGQPLGEIVITRSRLFVTKEVEIMENLMCSLVYPLRNATMYQLAMMSAFQDPLTGINNRASLEKSLPREISLAQRHGTPLTLMVIDVDHFKQINDTHGHQVGDTVLRDLTRVYAESVRTTDLVFRYGGDEFVIALSNTDLAGARDVAERIRDGIEKCHFTVGNVRLVISASIGLTQLNGRDTLESAFRRADEALLLAKREGRNRVAQV
ncbi:MAG: GGDEF domain-containing protein [Pseudomonadota bacterium]